MRGPARRAARIRATPPERSGRIMKRPRLRRWLPVIAAIGILLAVAAFVMQVGVQGAWGVIPAHLNELAPDSARGLIPGLAYQIGILFAAPTNTIEYALRDAVGYKWALALFEVCTIALLAIIIAAGNERRGRSFTQERSAAAVS